MAKVALAKSAIKSKTLWWNVLTAALYLVQGPIGVAIPEHVAVYIVTAGNFILRFLTDKPVKSNPLD